MARTSAQPSVREVSFDCPHCGAYAAQAWFDLLANSRPKDHRTPSIATPEGIERARSSKAVSDEDRDAYLSFAEQQVLGLVFLEDLERSAYGNFRVQNLYLSKCYACSEFAVWIHDRLTFPTSNVAPPANPDLPDEVRLDYHEAGRILDLSPRGAAALLRLAIQKLCVALGEQGQNIDDDIAALVKKGLAPLVQKSLDAVRVIGNEAVHPGTLDLKDDRDTASRLFQLINIIAEQLISNPKHVNEVYERLPEAKRKAIEKRDKRP